MIMYRGNFLLGLLLLSNSSPASSFQGLGGRSLVSPSHAFRALQVRGGSEDIASTTETSSSSVTATTITTEESSYEAQSSAEIISESIESIAVAEDSSRTPLPTYQRYMSKIRQPTSEAPLVESLLESETEVKVFPETTGSTSLVSFLSALSFSNIIDEINYFYGSAVQMYPSLKLVFAVVFAAMVLKIIVYFLGENEIPEPEVEPKGPAIEEFNPPDKPDNALQMALTLVAGGLGLVAGSLAMVADHVDCEGETDMPITIPSSKDDDSKEGETDALCKQKAIGAGGAALACGIGSRAVIIGKVLSIWF